MNVLSLFSGIGGLDKGLQDAGMTIVAQVERDEFCRSVLRRHWPDVPHHDDVATFADWWDQEERPHVDVTAGGFPCQPFSIAGLGLGVADERWMWPAMAAVIRKLRPRYVIVENVPALIRDRVAFGWLLHDLAELGFDAEWSLLPACAMGAPHPRERLLLVAYADSGDGLARMGPDAPRNRQEEQSRRARAHSWRDRVAGSVAASRSDDRDADGLARRMVEAGGNAVVPAVAEHIGRLIMQAAA